MARRGLLVAALALVAWGANEVAASPATFVVQGDRSVGGLVLGHGTPPQARLRFGVPASMRATPQSCVVRWPGLGLRVAFLAFDGPACSGGLAVQATITNRARWRTALGLRVGDGTQRVKALYPHASAHGGELWLVTRRTCELGGFQPYAGLLARIRNGRVSALVASAGVCE